MELSFLFTIVIILFLILTTIGTIANKNIDQYQQSRYSYFIAMFTSTSIFIMGVLFATDAIIQYNKRNKL